MKFTQRQKRILFYGIVGLSLLTILLVQVSLSAGQDLLTIIRVFARKFYDPSVCSFTTFYINGIHINIFSYLGILIAIVLIGLVRRRSGAPLKMGLLKRDIFRVILAFYFLMIGFQTIGQGIYFKDMRKRYKGKTYHEKKVETFGKIYIYSLNSRRLLPGRHQGKLITDMDISRDPGMINHRSLAYLLYPIDIRRVRGDGEDCLVVFNKKDAMASVSEEYEIIQTFGPYDLLARKKVTDVNN